jgi:hypothetical protein
MMDAAKIFDKSARPRENKPASGLGIEPGCQLAFSPVGIGGSQRMVTPVK